MISKLKKLLNNKKKNTKESDDSYCRSKIVYNSNNHFIILLSFTKEYFLDIVELLDDINNSNNKLSTKIKISSYEEEAKDADGNDIIIEHRKYYLLIGGWVNQWVSLYKACNNLGNEALRIISEDISNIRPESEFKCLIDDCVIQRFSSDPDDVVNHYDTDSSCVINKSLGNGMYEYYTNPKVLMSRLPDAFKSADLLSFIYLSFSENETIATLKQEILCGNVINYTEEKFDTSTEYYILKELFNYIDIEYLKLIMGPVYKLPDEDLSSLPGSISDEFLDDIFKEKYEKFSAIAGENMYEDIDEIILDDEEEGNSGGE